MAILALLFAGCGGGDEDDETVGDVLVAIGSAVCDRAIECGLIVQRDRGRCESQFQEGACESGDCAASYAGDTDDVEACIDAFDNFSCTMLDDGTVPSRCMSL